MRHGLGPEQTLLIECVKRTFGQEQPLLAERDIDWQLFARLALQQGLGPLVYAGLGCVPTPVPEQIRGQLRLSYTNSVFRTKVELQPTLSHTLEVLHAAGIEPIVLKGAALAYLAYRQPYHRTLIDIDLLVRSDQLPAADEALRDAGFLVADVDLADGHHHLPPYVWPDRRFLVVELHHDLLPATNPYALNLDQFWARSQLRKLGAVEARVLSLTDALLHVCVHLAYGHRYQWYSLRTLTDILALTTVSNEALDWDLLVDTVLQSRTAGAVYWLLQLSRDWLNAPVPGDVLSRLAPTGWLQRTVDPVLSSPYVLDGKAPDGLGTSVLYSLVRELSLYGGCSRREQLRAIRSCLFPAPDALAHLPADLKQSRVRYAAYLGGPGRVVRGAVAMGRLLARLPGPADWH